MEPQRAGLKAYRAINELEDIRKTIYDPERQNNAKKISEIRTLIGTLRRNKIERDLKFELHRQSIE